MAISAPAFQLDKKVFDRLLEQRKIANDKEFAEVSGLSPKSLSTIRSGSRDVTMKNVLLILDAFPYVTFETLFKRNPDVPAYQADEYADLKAAA